VSSGVEEFPMSTQRGDACGGSTVGKLEERRRWRSDRIGGKEPVAAATLGMQSTWSKSADVRARARWEEEADRWPRANNFFQV
jgi:hypothetical protein